jgi:KDO2-lipid IV(A) lauroyltransferase
MMPTGPIDVALRTGATVIPAFCVRTEKDSVDAYLEEALEMEQTGDMERDIRTNTLRFLARLERRLRDHPDQWVVLESIWDGVPVSSERPPAAVEGKA